MTVVDASVWISSLLADDVNHDASRQWFASPSGDAGLVVPSLALAEVGGAISRRTRNASLGRNAVDLLLRTLGLRVIPLDRELAKTAADLAAEHALRGADAVYVAVAQLTYLPLLTLDREVLARAAGVVPVTGV